MNRNDKRPFWFLVSQHWLSLAGLAVLMTAFVSWVVALPVHMRGHVENPYAGLLIFLVLPAIFMFGLVLVPIGVILGKRRNRASNEQAEFNRGPALRRLALVLGIMTVVNVFIGAQLSYRAVEHMETPQFCGATCHTMAPEFAAYHDSPHSRVECVGCHVTPGVSGWVSSKVSGVRQLVETLTKSHRTPIPSAIESGRLVPARQTCENCHWPERFAGATLRVINKYAEDEANSRTQTVLMMMVGGNRFAGIHGSHVGPGISIRFAAEDAARQTIPWIEYRNTSTGRTAVFSTPESSKEKIDKLPQREMECVDCHNRPTHTFDLPERALDRALAQGDIATTLPFVKKQGHEALRANYSSRAAAASEMPKRIVDFYSHNYPDLYAKRGADVERAAHSILGIYNRNVFPDLKVSWGTYPNNLGHTDFPGCFRCHDGSHTSADGHAISQDCSSCHEALATDEASPEILKTLGLDHRIAQFEKR